MRIIPLRACQRWLSTTILLAGSLAGLAYGEVPRPTATPTAQERNFLELARDLFSGRIRLAGRIVDERGELLKNVTIHVTKVYFDPTGADFRREVDSTIQSANGLFSIGCTVCQAIYLRVAKDGYYDEKLGASTGGEKTHQETHRPDLVVTLQQCPPLGRGYLRSEGIPHWNRPFEGTALFLRQPGRQSRVQDIAFRDGQAHTVHWTTRAVDPQPTTERFLYLVPAGGLGAAPDKQPALLADGTPQRDTFRPKGIRLCFSHPDDGFVAAQPKRPQNSELGLRDVREAPSAGYEQCLDLRSDQSYSFFYCRIGGLYGKGKANMPRFSPPGGLRSVYSGVEVLLFTDGSRNTEGP